MADWNIGSSFSDAFLAARDSQMRGARHKQDTEIRDLQINEARERAKARQSVAESLGTLFEQMKPPATSMGMPPGTPSIAGAPMEAPMPGVPDMMAPMPAEPSIAQGGLPMPAPAGVPAAATGISAMMANPAVQGAMQTLQAAGYDPLGTIKSVADIRAAEDGRARSTLGQTMEQEGLDELGKATDYEDQWKATVKVLRGQQLQGQHQGIESLIKLMDSKEEREFLKGDYATGMPALMSKIARGQASETETADFLNKLSGRKSLLLKKFYPDLYQGAVSMLADKEWAPFHRYLSWVESTPLVKDLDEDARMAKFASLNPLEYEQMVASGKGPSSIQRVRATRAAEAEGAKAKALANTEEGKLKLDKLRAEVEKANAEVAKIRAGDGSKDSLFLEAKRTSEIISDINNDYTLKAEEKKALITRWRDVQSKILKALEARGATYSTDDIDRAVEQDRLERGEREFPAGGLSLPPAIVNKKGGKLEGDARKLAARDRANELIKKHTGKTWDQLPAEEVKGWIQRALDEIDQGR